MTDYNDYDALDVTMILRAEVGPERVVELGPQDDPEVWDKLRLASGMLFGRYLDLLSGDPSTDQDSAWRAFVRDAVAVAAHHLDGDRVAAYGALSQALREVADEGEDDDRLAA